MRVMQTKGGKRARGGGERLDSVVCQRHYHSASAYVKQSLYKLADFCLINNLICMLTLISPRNSVLSKLPESDKL